jgi:hypothetical protein
MVMG